MFRRLLAVPRAYGAGPSGRHMPVDQPSACIQSLKSCWTSNNLLWSNCRGPRKRVHSVACELTLHGSNFLWVLAAERLLPVWYEGKRGMLGDDPAFFFCWLRCNPAALVACLRCFTEGPCRCSLVSSFCGRCRFLDSGLISCARGLRAVWFFPPVCFLIRRMSLLHLAADGRFGWQNLFSSDSLGHLACWQPAGFVTCMSITTKSFRCSFGPNSIKTSLRYWESEPQIERTICWALTRVQTSEAGSSFAPGTTGFGSIASAGTTGMPKRKAMMCKLLGLLDMVGCHA